MKYAKYSAQVVVVLLGVVLMLYPKLSSDSENLKQVLSQESVKGYNSVPVYQNGGYVGSSPEVSLSEVNREIEISPQDVIDNDTDNLIGTNEPFNIRFITEEDVVDSIKSILSNNGYREDLFESKYLSYVVTLRHAEMADMVPERDSEVVAVAKEYQEKIIGGNTNETPPTTDSIFGE